MVKLIKEFIGHCRGIWGNKYSIDGCGRMYRKN